LKAEREYFAKQRRGWCVQPGIRHRRFDFKLSVKAYAWQVGKTQSGEPHRRGEKEREQESFQRLPAIPLPFSGRPFIVECFPVTPANRPHALLGRVGAKGATTRGRKRERHQPLKQATPKCTPSRRTTN